MNRDAVKLYLLLAFGVLGGLFLAMLWVAPAERPPFLFYVLTILFTAAIIQAQIWWRYLRPIRDIAGQLRNVPEQSFSFAGFSLRQDEIGLLKSRLTEMAEAFRRQVETVVADREEIRAVLTSMSECVLVIGVDKKVLHSSQASVRMLGLRVADPVGRYYWEVIRHNEVLSLIETGLRSLMSAHKELVLPGTEDCYFSAHVSPVIVTRGRLHSIVVVIHDISALKKYDRMRSDFVANVSHELKTPLTSIRGFTETLKSGALQDPQAAMRFLDIIEAQAMRLEKLVSDILILSSLESKTPTTAEDKGSQSLLSIIKDVLELQATRIREKQHIVDVDIPGTIPSVFGDRIQLEQVFQNLIDNAVKYTPAGGKITVRALLEGNMVRMDVIDSGIGIPAEHIDRLFERFYRVDKARSQEMGGTGLGLAIVKHIIQAHHGKLTVQSQPGHGSTFTVLLPKL